MSNSITMINPFTGKVEDVKNPNPKTLYIMNVLKNEKDLSMITWWVKFRFSENPHDSALFAMHDILTTEQVVPDKIRYVMQLLHRYAYNLSRKKEVEDEETKI